MVVISQVGYLDGIDVRCITFSFFGIYDCCSIHRGGIYTNTELALPITLEQMGDVEVVK